MNKNDLNFINNLYHKFVMGSLRHNLIQPGDVVVAAVSGGADSTALLDLLNRWRLADGGFTLIGSHFNHHLRPEADAEQEFVIKMFCEVGILYRIGGADIAEYARAKKRSEHDMARELRYQFLDTTAQEFAGAGGLKIATGHHRDDQVETVLMRLFDGASPDAMMGIRRKMIWGENGIELIRPILDISREELEEYCRTKQLNYVSDHSNFDTSYPRNRIRHLLSPEISRLFGEKAFDGICRTAEWFDFIHDDFHGSAEKVYAECVTASTESEISIDYCKFSLYLDIMRKFCIRRAAQNLNADPIRISSAQMEAVMNHLIARKPGVMDLCDKISLTICKDRIFVFKPVKLVKPKTVKLPGKTNIPGWGILKASIIPYHLENRSFESGVLFIDKGCVNPLMLQIRQVANGDRFIPFGMEGHRLVKDFLQERGIPVHRRSYPVVVAGDQIVLIPPFQIDNSFRISEKTCEIIRFDWEQI